MSDSGSAMFQVSYKPVLRDPSTPAGLSLVMGEPVKGIEDLPLFKVVVRVFQNAAQAEAFTLGMDISGQTNKIAYTWQEGDSIANRTVFVGLLQEEVSADCPFEDRVEIIDYRTNGMDGRAMQRFYDKAAEERAADQARLVAETDARFAPLAPQGFKLLERYTGTMRIKSPAGETVTLKYNAASDGPYSVSISSCELSQGSVDVRPTLDAEIAKTRCVFGELHEHMRIENVASIDGVSEAVAELERTKKELEAAKSAYWQAEFVKKTKMTAARKRFLDQMLKYGSYEYSRRSNHRVRAGTEDIGVTEFNTLLRVGWIIRGKEGLEVTDVGLEKAGLVRPQVGEE